jgi:hypothetical protein
MTHVSGTFVFAIVGEPHVRAVNIALTYLKRFSRSNIVVVMSRSGLRPAHDQVIDVELPDQLDDRAASIFLKTSLLEVLGPVRSPLCYLDSDVIAVNDDVDSIFKHKHGPVTFASDNVSIDMFTRYAINCGCQESTCNHLRECIVSKFGVPITLGDWRLWNGGVFLFDSHSADFLRVWHELTRQILTDSLWRTRDQGTLAAAVWKCGLQDQPRLPRAFNFIVDRFWGLPVSERFNASPSRFHVWNDYSLTGEGRLPRPSLLHFVNGGVGQAGWQNWDEVESLLCDLDGERDPS